MSLNKTFFALLIFLSAGNAFLVEANIMHSISATLGGTILHYQVGIGIFIVCLGFGSLFYPKANRSFSNISILKFSAVSLLLLGLSSPYAIYWCDQLFNLTINQPLYLIYYIPIACVGLITGLDLPCLIFLGQNQKTLSEEVSLGLDYFGMFAGGILFPTLLLQFGVFNNVIITSALSLLTLLILQQMDSNSEPCSSHDFDNLPIPKRKLLLSCFLIAFCSLCYELLLARWMVDFFENEIYAITYSVSAYLLGLSLGSLSFKKKNLSHQIWKTEVIIILSVLLAPIFFYTVASAWKLMMVSIISKNVILGVFLTLIAWIGFWSGRELPIVMSAAASQKNWPLLFFYNYLGALIATLFTVFILIPQLGILGGLLVVIGFNIISLVILNFLFPIKKSKLIASLAIMVISLMIVPQKTIETQQIFLKVIYHKLGLHELNSETLFHFKKLISELNDIHRIETSYQNIDLVRYQIPQTGTGVDDLILYLNHQPQFTIDSHNLYHDSFSFGALHLAQTKPNKVLILGGGDGILASRLAEVPSIKDIHLIELDPEMIELAKNHYRISKANKDIFKTDRITLTIGDAYSWLKKNQEKFDGIFIDFPYPTNYELSRLYSIEFYDLIYRSLSDDGFVIFNAPFSFDLDRVGNNQQEPSKTLINTVKSAGFASTLAFGAIEPFLYAEKKKRKITFNYDDSLSTLSNSSFINLTPINEIQNLAPSDQVNSVYFPKRIITW